MKLTMLNENFTVETKHKFSTDVQGSLVTTTPIFFLIKLIEFFVTGTSFIFSQ